MRPCGRCRSVRSLRSIEPPTVEIDGTRRPEQQLVGTLPEWGTIPRRSCPSPYEERETVDGPRHRAERIGRMAYHNGGGKRRPTLGGNHPRTGTVAGAGFERLRGLVGIEACLSILRYSDLMNQGLSSNTSISMSHTHQGGFGVIQSHCSV